MGCNSAISGYNNAALALTPGSIIPLGTVNRRFGCNLNLSGNGLLVSGAGYYDIGANVTLTATAAGVVTVALFENGVQIPGAISQQTVAVGDVVTLPLRSLIRLQCCNSDSNVTVVLGGVVATVNNISWVAEKV